MLELLKKIGIPATVAAVIASLVTIVPFLFKIDERYAKDSDLDAVTAKFEKKIEKQNREIAQLAGYQQAMIMFLQQGRSPSSTAALSPPVEPVAATPAPMPAPAPVAAAPHPKLTAPAELFVVKPAADAASKPPRPIEKPTNWRELNDGLMRQQSRLIKE